MMLLLGFSICFVLRLLLLCRLQPGEPLVYLTEGKQSEELAEVQSILYKIK